MHGKLVSAKAPQPSSFIPSEELKPGRLLGALQDLLVSAGVRQAKLSRGVVQGLLDGVILLAF